jgi:hypothetical protein
VSGRNSIALWPISRPMRTDPLECALWIGALAAPLGGRFRFDPETQQMAEVLMIYYRPKSKA